MRGLDVPLRGLQLQSELTSATGECKGYATFAADGSSFQPHAGLTLLPGLQLNEERNGFRQSPNALLLIWVGNKRHETIRSQQRRAIRNSLSPNRNVEKPARRTTHHSCRVAWAVAHPGPLRSEPPGACTLELAADSLPLRQSSMLPARLVNCRDSTYTCHKGSPVGCTGIRTHRAAHQSFGPHPQPPPRQALPDRSHLQPTTHNSPHSHLNTLSATPKLPTPHIVMIASMPSIPASDAPSSITARSASLRAVRGSTAIAGCTISGKLE